MINRLDRSVTVWVQGGLGNQLFQWNAGIYAAQALNAPLLLSPASFRRDPLRTMSLTPVLPAGLLTTRWEDALIGPPFSRSGDLRRKTLLRRSPIVDSWHDVDTPGTILVGFFQDERSLALETSAVVGNLQGVRAHLASTDLGRLIDGRVAAHVRRGDYVTAVGAIEAFGQISERYYRDSLDYLDSRLEDTIFFTDEPDYVVSTFGVKRSMVVGPQDTATDLDSMMLMSLSSALVIPNSTFSWWAAESMGPDARVVSPESWFVDERRGENVARPTWARIPN
jgi:hypothetical protein